MDIQTVYKHSAGYYQIQKIELLAKGYEVTEDNKVKTTFIKKDNLLTNKETNI